MTGVELELTGIVGTKIGPASAPKGSKKGIIGFLSHKILKGIFITNYLRWKPIYEENHS